MTRSPSRSDLLALGAFRAAAAVVGRLPTGLSVNLGALLGGVSHGALPIRRRLVRRNLDWALGETHTVDERRRIERATYRHLGMLAAECLGLWQHGPEWLDRQIVGAEGMELAEPILSSGSPFLVVTGHFGNWEMLGAYFGHRSKLSVLAKPLHNTPLDQQLSTMRRRHGLELIDSTGASVARDIFKAVRTGRTVCFLADQDARHTGIFVPFFGRPASTFTGPALIALRLNAPMIPAFLLRLSPGRHRVLVRAPIHPPPNLPTDQAVHWLTREHVRALEDVVRLAPAQYFWFHRRWKTEPKT